MRKWNAARAAQAMMALGVAGVLVAAAPPQDKWEQQVRTLLQRASNTTSSSGFVETNEPHLGQLREGQNTSWTVRLNAGTEYRIVGVCDNDCSDIDLKLFNPAGTMVDEDIETDDVPVLSITPPATREYTIRAIMATCSVNPCRFGVGYFGR
jgi:hypothetical protein